MTILSADEFIRLRTSEDPDDYRRAANEDAPLDVWIELVERHADLRSWVAHNKTVPVQVLERLARDTDPHVRSAVALRRRATGEILARLAGDDDAGVRLHVARHSNTPSEVLVSLADDEWDQVRTAALANLGR